MSLSRGAFAVALLLSSTLASPAAAQVPEGLRGASIVEVRIAGETSGATTAREVGVPIGAPLSRRVLRDAAMRLLESGHWSDVQIDVEPAPGGVSLVVSLTPRVLISRVDVVGATALEPDAVRSALGVAPGSEVEPGRLASIAQVLAEHYNRRGYVDARIELRLRETDDPTQKVLRVVVSEGEPLRIAEIAYVPAPPPDEADVGGALGLGEGDVLDRGRLELGVRAAERQLRERGWLEARVRPPTFERREEGARLRIPLHVGPRYTPRILGHEPLSRGAVEEVLQLAETRLTRASLATLDDRVVELYRRHGFHRVSVEVERIIDDEAELEGAPAHAGLILEVRIDAGPRLEVVAVAFPGALHFDSEHLSSELSSVLADELPDTRLFAPVDSDTVDRIGFGGRIGAARRRRVPRPLELDPNRIYYEPAYARALEHIQEVYQAAGYLSAEVGPAELREVVEEENRAIVLVPIVEGPRTMLHGVRIRGNSVLGDRALLEAAGLERATPFSYLALEEASARITELYGERGYIYARVDADVRFSVDRERAEVLLTIVERFPVRFGEIRVEGPERTSETLIRERLRFAEGDLYRPSVVQASQDALMALGIFTSVAITPVDPDVPEQIKPVTVSVRERLPQYADVTLGLSTGQGLRVGGEYAYRNIFGYGVTVSLRGQAGFQFFFQDPFLEENITALPLVDRLERRIALSMLVPHLSGLDNVRASLDIVHLRDNERAFGLDKNGVVLSFVWRPINRVQLTLSGELENNNVRLLGDRADFDEFRQGLTDPRLQQILRVPQGDSWVVSSRVSGAIDQRDNPFSPTRGFYASANVEWAHTLDTEAIDDEEPFFSHFLKMSVTLNGYVPIDEWVIAMQGRVGYVQHLADRSQTYPNRQFFVGGVDSLRGFNQDQLQPQDIAELQLENPELRGGNVVQGGDLFVLLRLEVRFPIVESLQGGIFADIGNHWADPRRFDLFQLRPTAGLGLRIVTPVGPLALDYGVNLLRRDELFEPFGAFHFSIGLF